MRGRTEEVVPMNMIRKPYSIIMTKVSQAKVINRGGHPKWIIQVYHTPNGIAYTILFLSPNIGGR